MDGGRRAAGGGEAFTLCLTRERRRVTCLDSRPAGDVRATAGRRALARPAVALGRYGKEEST